MMITNQYRLSQMYFSAFENTASGAGQYTVNPGDVRDIYNLSDVAKTDIIDVSITKTVDKPQAIDQEVLTYTITITNNSSIPINNVILRDIIDENTIYDATNPIPYEQLQQGYNVGTIQDKSAAPNNVYTLVFTVTVNENQLDTVVNTATLVSYNYTDANGITYTGNSQEATASTEVQLISVDYIKAVSPANAVAGDEVTYTLTVNNASSLPINDVIIKETSIDLQYLNITRISLNGTVITPTPSLLTGVNVGTIAAGDSVVLTLVATVLETTSDTIENTGLLDYSYIDNGVLIQETDVASNPVTLNIIRPALSLDKNVSTSIIINDGTSKTLLYTIYINNTGNVDLNNVVLTDELPVGTTYLENSTYIDRVGPTNNSPEDGIVIGTIPARSSVEVIFRVNVTF